MANLTQTWKEKFQTTFQFHPDRDEIMNRLLSDEPITINQLDKWYREADECADAQRQIQLQRLSGEPDEAEPDKTKVA